MAMFQAPISRHRASAKVPAGRTARTVRRRLLSSHTRAIVRRGQTTPRMPFQSHVRLGPPDVQRRRALAYVWLQVAKQQARELAFPQAVALHPELAPAHQCRNSPSPSARAKPLRPGECRSQAFDLDEPCPHRKSVAAESNYVALFWKAKYGKKNATILARGG